jgi:hypothetical protein
MGAFIFLNRAVYMHTQNLHSRSNVSKLTDYLFFIFDLKIVMVKAVGSFIFLDLIVLRYATFA